MQSPSRRFSRLMPASSDSNRLSGCHTRPSETVFPPEAPGLCLCGSPPYFTTNQSVVAGSARLASAEARPLAGSRSHYSPRLEPWVSWEVLHDIPLMCASTQRAACFVPQYETAAHDGQGKEKEKEIDNFGSRQGGRRVVRSRCRLRAEVAPVGM